MTPEALMRQAAMTAELYAREGAKVYQDIFAMHPSNDPRAAVRINPDKKIAAAHDFDTSTREINK